MSLSLPELQQRLLALGAQEVDLPLIIQDVQKMILAKLFVEISTQLTPEVEAALTDMTTEQLQVYSKEHPEVFSGLTEAAIEATTTQTWESYFAAVEQPVVS